MRRALLAILFLACRRETPSPAPVATVSATVSAVPSASVSAAPVETNRYKAIALRWSDALNARDEATLRTLHTPMVRFYGSHISNEEYIARIRKALAKDPTFHQTITFTNLEWRNSNNVKVSFRKKDNKRETPAYLVIQGQIPKDEWLIVEESDIPSDALPPTCYAYDTTITLTGTVEDSFYIVNDKEWPAQILQLERPICVREGKDESEPSVDAIEELHLRDGTPQTPGKRSVKGKLNYRDMGSPYYATSVTFWAD